jgi:hypothetical protein
MTKQTVIAVTLVVCIILTMVPTILASQSLQKPDVTIPTFWSLKDEIPYPNISSGWYDPAGCGRLWFVNQNEAAMVVIWYESAGGKFYSNNDLVDEAIKIFDSKYADELTDFGIMSVAGNSVGYAKSYNYEENFYTVEMVLVDNDYYLEIGTIYPAEAEIESQVMSLISSLSVGPDEVDTNLLIILPIVAIAVIIIIIIYRITRQRKITQSLSIGAFPIGWQFYEGLTAGDPPGTVYRFTKKKGKQRVETIKAPEYPIELDIYEEEVGNYTHTATTDTFLQFTGLKTSSFLTKMQDAHKLKLEMPGLLRETTSDVNLDPLIEQLVNKKNFHFRDDDQYFVIRQARKTKEINYLLSQESIEDLGGEAALKEAELKAKNLTYVKQRQVIKQKFDTYRRVMFCAEEIKLKRDKNGKILIVR